MLCSLLPLRLSHAHVASPLLSIYIFHCLSTHFHCLSLTFHCLRRDAATGWGTPNFDCLSKIGCEFRLCVCVCECVRLRDTDRSLDS